MPIRMFSSAKARCTAMGPRNSFAMRINAGEKDELRVKGYRFSKIHTALAVVAILFTFGLAFLLILWKKSVKMLAFYKACDFQHATKVLVEDSFNQLFDEDVLEGRFGSSLSPKTRYFVNKKLKYVWDDHTQQFCKFKNFDESGLICNSFHDDPGGLSNADVDDRERQFGTNFIEISVPPFYLLAFQEISNPFYLFQMYTVCIWMIGGYFDYASLVLVTSLVAIFFSVRQTRKQMMKLRKMNQAAGSITVVRGGIEKRIISQKLVPGDVICINPQANQPLYCDAVLIDGSCSVDESMLTGESYPITKIPIPREDAVFQYEQHKRHVLFSGTVLMQGRASGNSNWLKAVVIRTGFSTTKGALMRGILFPKPIRFRFYTDLIKVAGLFFVFGLGGFVYTLYSFIKNGAAIKEIIIRSLDIATIAIPPMLPAALTATTAFAQARLKQKKIYCLSAKHISLCGGVDVVCFDKTGTLTETDVDLAGAIPIQEGLFDRPVERVDGLPDSHPLLVSVATCHSLIILPESGQLGGYSLDKKLFESTGWCLKNGPSGVNSAYGLETPFLVESQLSEVAVLKRFPFESSVKRMTVVAQKRGHDHFNVYIKGAPETVASLCDSRSIPSNFEAVLTRYTIQGFRVLALAAKTLSRRVSWTEIQRMTRTEIESRPMLIGFLVMRNALKKETLPTIRVLHEAKLVTVMVTGDNLQTAVTVARDCQMIDRSKRVIQVEAKLVPASAECAQHLQVVYFDPMLEPEFINGTVRKLQDVHNGNFCFALDGKSFGLLQFYDPNLLERCVHRAKVFARMAPEHKTQLMEILQKLGHQVAMVGDGCNDCGALRTADAGISLSMADASVAAPFTSQATNISCVPPLLREGRTSLDAAFGTFQFATSMNFTTFAAILMLYSTSNGPSDFQFFIWYITIVLTPFYCIGHIAPPEYLVARRPLRYLWGFLPMFSFFTFLFWQILALVIGWLYCRAQPWYEPYVFNPEIWPPNPSYEETTIFWFLCWNCITSAFVFSPNEPYSLNFFANKVFVIWSFVALAITLSMMFVTDEAFVYQMNFKTPPHVEYTLFILFLALSVGLFCFCWEKYLIRGWLYQRIWPTLNRARKPRHLYQKIEQELQSKPDWPTVGTRDVVKKASEVIDMDGEAVDPPVDEAEKYVIAGSLYRSIRSNNMEADEGRSFGVHQAESKDAELEDDEVTDESRIPLVA